MKNNYIDGEVVELSEKGIWEEAKLKNKKQLQDVLLIEKNIILKSSNGKIYNIYCSKNINIKLGDYLYLRLNKNFIDEIYELKDDYKSAIRIKREYEDFKKFIIQILLSITIALILQPIFQMLVSFIYSMTLPTGNSKAENMSRWIASITGPESLLFCIGSYFMIFLLSYVILDPDLKKF